jgi:adenosylcobinamide-GDP ribazoletransferase
MSGFRVALSFLTRIPAGLGPHSEDRLARAVPWFPIVGALIGLAVAAVYAAASVLWFEFVAAALAIASGIVLTGAFHEDGLADAVDAFGAGRDRDQTVRILKDPTIGTFGGVALVATFVLRAGALAMLPVASAWLVLPAAHALSRAVAIGALGWIPPAGEGLGASYGRSVTRARAVTAIAAGLVIATVTMGLNALVAVGVCGVAVWGWSRVAVKRLGGLPGDVLGAIQQTGEVAILLLAAAMDWGLSTGSMLGG